MKIGAILIVAALVFGVCFLFDKGFAALFRGKAQHASGLSIRANKRYAVFGVLLIVLGVAALLAGIGGSWALLLGGIVVGLTGICLITYYLSFGIFYDADSFILSSFGRKNRVYQFQAITGQQLYNSQGLLVVELYLNDGRTVMLQEKMEGVFPFLDHAFSAWCRQKHIDPASCDFHDPDNSCWFPTPEVK